MSKLSKCVACNSVRDDVQSSRCEHHYVFSIHKEDENPVIVAVLHENMDLINRLNERLGET